MNCKITRKTPCLGVKADSPTMEREAGGPSMSVEARGPCNGEEDAILSFSDFR